MKEPKSISRSIRMTESVYEFVSRHVGNGFNQKFEHLCLRFMWEEPELDRRIKEKRKLLEGMVKQINTIQNGLRTAEYLNQQMSRTKAELERMLIDCNSKPVPQPAADREN